MIYSSSSFFLNLKESTSDVYLRIKNGDTARQYRCTLIDGDIVYQLADDCYAKLIAKIPNEAKDTVLTNCRIIDNKVSFNLTPSLSTAQGYIECELRIYSRDDELVITSPRFYMYAEASLYSETAPEAPVYAARVVQLSLPSYAWVGEKSPYSQMAMVDRSITAHSKVDLQPTPTQLEAMRSKEIGLQAQNNGGTITVVAIGTKPAEDMTMQATVTEVQ